MLRTEKEIALTNQFHQGSISAYDYEMGMLDLRFNSDELKQTDEYALSKLKIQKDYEKIDNYNYDMKTMLILSKSLPEKERKKKQLEIMLRYGKIHESDYTLNIKQLDGIPFGLIRLVYDESKNDQYAMFDVKYNKLFVADLRRKGYTGVKDDEVVEMWVKQQYQNVALSEDLEIETYEDMLDDEDYKFEQELIDEEFNSGS